MVAYQSSKLGVWVQIPLSTPHGDMAKLADAPDLGSGAERRMGSSPFIPTRFHNNKSPAKRRGVMIRYQSQAFQQVPLWA